MRHVTWWSPRPGVLEEDTLETRVSQIRTLAFPPRNGTAVVADVIDDAFMPRETMTQICKELGLSAALSWLASHARDLRR